MTFRVYVPRNPPDEVARIVAGDSLQFLDNDEVRVVWDGTRYTGENVGASGLIRWNEGRERFQTIETTFDIAAPAPTIEVTRFGSTSTWELA